jgi:predicted transcriptional regulator
MSIERTNSFHLLLSDDELKLLKLLAEREGLNASDYLRMLIRTMPNTSQHLLHGMRLGAVLGSNVDLSKLFEAHSDAARQARPGPEEAKKKKAK